MPKTTKIVCKKQRKKPGPPRKPPVVSANEIRRLKREEGLSQAMIGFRYGITADKVRQILARDAEPD